MKITLDVRPEVVEVLRAYAIDIGGGSRALSERAALHNGLVAVAEVALNQRVFDILANYGAKRLKQCAWCNRFHVEGKWLKLLSIADHQVREYVSHGICPECLIQEQAKQEDVSSPFAGVSGSRA